VDYEKHWVEAVDWREAPVLPEILLMPAAIS
jgi:hypothetical protein